MQYTIQVHIQAWQYLYSSDSNCVLPFVTLIVSSISRLSGDKATLVLVAVLGHSNLPYYPCWKAFRTSWRLISLDDSIWCPSRTSKVSLHSLLSRRLVLAGGAGRVHGLGGMTDSVRLSLRKLMERCSVCPMRFRGAVLTGGMRLANEVTRDRGFTRLLLGSLMSRLHRLRESTSLICFLFFPLNIQLSGEGSREKQLFFCSVGPETSLFPSLVCMWFEFFHCNIFPKKLKRFSNEETSNL